MFTDARIGAALKRMVTAIDAPPVPLLEIQGKISQPQTVVRSVPRYLQLALATAAMIAIAVLAFPSNSLGVVQTIEARYRAVVQAMGGIPPAVAPPKSLLPALSPQNATPTTAQSRVSFKLVTPAGLPHDIVSAKIQTTPVAVYSKTAHAWGVGSKIVTYYYDRAGGRSFDLTAERYNPREPPARYMFEAKDPTADGRPVIIKHEKFAWRNGNQTMTVVEGEGITASEIEAIRVAMHGVALPTRELHTPTSGTRFIILRKP